MATIVAGDMYVKLDGQLHEIKRQIRQPNGYPFDPEKLSDGLQALVEGKFRQGIEPAEQIAATNLRPRIEILRELPKPCAKRTVDEQVAGMETLYKLLGWTFTTSGLAVPERREGFNRLMVFGDATLTNNRVYDACDASFPSWWYKNDLDLAVPPDKDERHPKNGVYAVWVRDRVEADEELKNLSANMVAEKRLKTMTLLERELLELVHFRETGRPLDVKNRTLCSGSRYSDGRVPGACWSGAFGVFWRDPSVRRDSLRSRAVVTLEP